MVVTKKIIPHKPRSKYLQSTGDVTIYNKITDSGETTSSNGGYRYIWGQYYDGLHDIEGDMTNVGNIESDGVISTTDSMVTNSLYVNTALFYGDLKSKDITPDSDSSYNIGTEHYNYLNGYIKNIKSNNIISSNANIDNLVSSDIHTGNVTADNLVVTGAAHFFKLIIDEVKSSGGQLILSSANIHADAVFNTTNNVYRIYQKSRDTYDNISLENKWTTDDLALCQTFNVSQRGENGNISNKIYWATVTDYGNFEGIDFYSDSTENAVIDAIQARGKLYYYDVDITSSLSFTQTLLALLMEFDEFRYFTNVTQTPNFQSSTIRTVTLPSSITYVTSNSFKDCTNLHSINLNSGLLTINEYAFSNTAITSIVIPASVTSIADYTFSYCPNLKNVYFLGTTPPSMGVYMFEGCSQLQNIFVPNGCVSAYKEVLNMQVSDYQSYVRETGSLSVSLTTLPITYTNYIYIDLDLDRCSPGTNGIPERGDDIVQLGNTVNSDRQAAIIISAYQSIDSGVAAPSIVQYNGISNFSLDGHRQNIISKGLNEFHGDFKITVGGSTTNVQDFATGIDTSLASLYVTTNGIRTQVQGIANNYVTSSQLNQTATSISAEIDQKVAASKEKKNLFTGTMSGEGWSSGVYDEQDQSVTINGDVNVDSGNLLLSGSSDNAVISPVIYLTGGQSYTFSCYIEGIDDVSLGAINYSSNEISVSWTGSINNRHQFTFYPLSSGYTRFFAINTYISCPLLEKGDYATEYEATDRELTSTIQMTADGIVSRVSDIETDYVTGNDLYNTSTALTSEFTQTASGITSRVSAIETDYAKSGDVTNAVTYMSSVVNQTANSIKAQVNSSLGATGIDISNGKIELRGDKVSFTNTAGTITDKISIDTDTGTLHATDGDFSGVVTANLIYTPLSYYTESDSYIYEGHDGIFHPSEKSSFTQIVISTNDVGVKLPLSSDYPGLKLEFFVPGVNPGTQAYGLTGEIIAQSGDSIQILQGNVAPIQCQSVRLKYNSVITIRSMSNAWYLISGSYESYTT